MNSMNRDSADVRDPSTGKVRVLQRRCDTCIFRPGDPMGLGAARIRQVIEANLQASALLTCHATLPYGPHPNHGPAVCAGFWAQHRNDVPAGRLAQLFLGVLRVPPPEHYDEHSDHDHGHCQEDTMPHPPPHERSHPLPSHTPGQPRAGTEALRGHRIRLISTTDPHTRLHPGALGTVLGTDSQGTLLVHWDDGSRLGLIPDEDDFEILAPAQPDDGDTR